MLAAFGMMAQAQNNVPICASDTVVFPDGRVQINTVLTLVQGPMDNKNFTVKNFEFTTIDGVVMNSSRKTETITYNRDSTYHLYHNGVWGYYTGKQIQQAVAPITTPLLISVGRNIFYKTERDSLWIPRTY